MDRPLDRRARAGANPALLARVAELLVARWDPRRELVTPDGQTAPMAHAAAIVGILAAGGRRAELVGYLRDRETAALGAPRSTGGTRWALAEEIRELVLTTPVPPVPSEPGDPPA